MKAKVAEKERPLAKEEERQTISVRNVSSRRWKALLEKARVDGRILWSVMDEMIDDYLKK
jgi:hypothetical protein